MHSHVVTGLGGFATHKMQVTPGLMGAGEGACGGEAEEGGQVAFETHKMQIMLGARGAGEGACGQGTREGGWVALEVTKRRSDKESVGCR